MAQATEGQPAPEPCPTPVDGGTLLPPVNAVEVISGPLPGLTSADSSLISDTSHVQQLINHGADVNAPDNNGWTPLHTAAYHGQEEIVRILLGANANVNARNRTEETPLHLAAKWPQDRVVEALLSGGADLTARNKRGRTPAHVAALFNRHAILDRLLNAGADVNAVDSENQTPLHLAVRANTPVDPELVKTLIRHSANLEVQDAKGQLPLHFLPCAQDWLHWAAYEGKEDLMRVLLAKPGVRPDCYSEEGLTPLHLAAHVNSTSMVTMLLNAGAKVNAPSQPPSKSSGKDTTFGIPVPGAPGSITAGISISSQLKAYGGSKLPPGELTALHIAAERGSAELIRVLVGAGAKVNIQGDRGMPPLHVAVWEGNTAAVVSLLAAKASVALKSKAGGFTSVHCACLSSRATPELMALLLDNGGAAVIEERCQEGWTALHLACQSAPPAMVELLLQRGARPGAKGKNGRTAADCAAKRPEILQILHVATGGKVPLPLGLSSVAAVAANSLLMPNGAGGASGTGGAGARAGGSAAAGASGASGSRSRGGASGAGGSGRSTSATSVSSSSQSGLLPGTAAVLEPLESVEATLAALLADMGGALCSLQAGGVFGAGACSVDPGGHCIRPLDKRLVMVCTLGCQFSFHLPCWMSAREVLKERWAGFTGSLTPGGRYSCIGPGCPGYIREQAICDGTQMQSASQSRLYIMPQEMYDSLPPQAKPIGGGVPPPPGSGDGGIIGGGGVQQPGTPLQPALPAGGGGGGLSSLAALAPSLTLAQAMVQAATAVGNMVGGTGRLATTQLAAALASSGHLQALLANPPPVPHAMSAREAAIVAAQTLGVHPGSSCVVEELGSEDEFDEDDGLGSAAPSGGGGGGGGERGASRSAGVASTSAGDSGRASAANGSGGGGSGGRKRGGGGGAGSGGTGGGATLSSSSGSSSSRRGGKGSGGSKALGGKSSSSASPISPSAAAEMLQQLHGLQQAVAAVQNAVGAGCHSVNATGSSSTSGGGGGGTCAVAAVPNGDAAAGSGTAAGAGTSGAGAVASPPPAPSAQEAVTVATLEPPPPLLPPASAAAGTGSGSEDPDGAAADGGGSGGGSSLQDAAPMPPPRRRNPPMPPMPRRVPQPEIGRQLVSPQLATPPPATSLLTPGVQQLLSVTVAAPAAPPASPLLPCQPDASLAPILVGPVPQLQQQPGAASPSGSKAGSAAAAAAAGKAGGSRAEDDGVSAAVASAASPLRAGRPEPMHVNGGGSSGAKAESASSSTGGSGSRASPRRSGGGAGMPVISPSGVIAGSAKSEFLAAIANGPAAAAAYGGRVTLTAPGLSIGFVHGIPLVTPTSSATTTSSAGVSPAAAAAAAAAQAQSQAVAGLTVTRATPGAKGAAAAGHHPATSLPLNAANFEPGGYARAVCPGLRPGVHRVTHSSGRVPAPPGATIVPTSQTRGVTTTTTTTIASGEASVGVPVGIEGTAAAQQVVVGEAREVDGAAPGVSGSGTAVGTASGAAQETASAAAGPGGSSSGGGGGGGGRTAAAASPAGPPAASEGTGETKPAARESGAGSSAGPAGQAAVSGGSPRKPVGSAQRCIPIPVPVHETVPLPAPINVVEPPSLSPAAAAAAPAAAAAEEMKPAPVVVSAGTASATGTPGQGASEAAAIPQASPAPAADHPLDIITAALHGLKAPPVASAPAGAAVAAAAPPTAAPAQAESDGATPSPGGRHLLLESGDIPLLASTPGMLEAWLNAHVGTHGKLAAHRILAPQAAVAVTLESEAAAAAAARSLCQRPTLLVQPLAVAPLREFPEDEVLAATAQQIAKAACPPGDRSWMRHMVHLWRRLEDLPPAVRHE